MSKIDLSDLHKSQNEVELLADVATELASRAEAADQEWRREWKRRTPLYETAAELTGELRRRRAELKHLRSPERNPQLHKVGANINGIYIPQLDAAEASVAAATTAAERHEARLRAVEWQHRIDFARACVAKTTAAIQHTEDQIGATTATLSELSAEIAEADARIATAESERDKLRARADAAQTEADAALVKVEAVRAKIVASRVG